MLLLSIIFYPSDRIPHCVIDQAHEIPSHPIAQMAGLAGHGQVFFLSNPEGGWKSRTAMKVARGDKAVAVLHDKLHVVGGETETKNSQGHSTPLMDVEAPFGVRICVAFIVHHRSS